MTKTLVLAALCATAAYAGSAGEAEHAARLESRVDAALERILGPRRAATLIEVRGERVTKTEQSQISGTRAHESAAGTEIFDLPGYTKKGASRPAIPVSGGTTMVQSATEETVREGSFAVSGVRAWLFLDKNLDDAAAAEAVRVSLEILAIEPDRGDTLKVVKTAFTPAWRAAFSRPRDARALMLLCLAAATFLFGVFLLRRRPQSVPAPQPSSA
ncbi:MAG: hypothetical protein ABL955_14810, partial [Elusimicrobiota bacterium]